MHHLLFANSQRICFTLTPQTRFILVFSPVRCKCNGHASDCSEGEDGRLACVCQHNTAGEDCQRCQAFYQDRPWARATWDSANECLSEWSRLLVRCHLTCVCSQCAAMAKNQLINLKNGKIKKRKNPNSCKVKS